MTHRLAPEAETDLDELWHSIAANASVETADPLVDSLPTAEIRARLDRADAGIATTIPRSEAHRRIHAATGRGVRAASLPSGVSCTEAHDDADEPHRNRP